MRPEQTASFQFTFLRSPWKLQIALGLDFDQATKKVGHFFGKEGREMASAQSQLEALIAEVQQLPTFPDKRRAKMHFPKLENYRPIDEEAEIKATMLYSASRSSQSNEKQQDGQVFRNVPVDNNFVHMEESVLQKWTKENTFLESVSQSRGRKRYSFYDGPPFATGLPHYGHILAGTIKDIVTRYAHQTGHFVDRRFGWDCHGLPVEYEIDKKLEIKGKEDVLALGMAKWKQTKQPKEPVPSEEKLWNMAIREYNAQCRAIVMRYSAEWKIQITRLGRWIDFDNDYKTMNPTFMESVWWVFKQLFDKKLVYQGYKVMPYSTVCTTPLSNFEAKQNYKDVVDPAIVVSFPLVSDPSVSLLAWTTTPWTLPSNLALCVNKDFDYVKYKDNASGLVRIAMKSRLDSFLYPKAKQGKKGKGPAGPLYTVLEEMKGNALVGQQYVPLFPYFEANRKLGAFKVLEDGYVQDDAGTGVVHQAPAFGEDDFRVCSVAGIVRKDAQGLVCPVDDNGKFTAEVVDFKGVNVKEADKAIIQYLRKQNRLVSSENFSHSYPHCWRSDSPLIYKAVPSWFVNVELIKPQLVANNQKTYWVPTEIGEKRFHNWLENARDWAISRNRYWGTPLPIWMNQQGEIRVMGSIADLEQATGQKIVDLHRESIDLLEVPSQEGGDPLRRVPEVFDCWFESGSMPYAQCHYPFENKESFAEGFPADFIAEGLDQTRGWFYTLMVLATALFDKPAFKNVVVNGLVLANDGKKMSKRLQNYDPVQVVVDEYGADALRLYLINSPVVRGDELKFDKKGVFNVVKTILIPWYNSYRLFVQSARSFQNRTSQPFQRNQQLAKQSQNAMDVWILASLHSLIQFVRQEMQGYRLYTVIPRLVQFVVQLSQWYIRFNKGRLLKAEVGEEDCQRSMASLFEVLYALCVLMAPFTPFVVEDMFQNLQQAIPQQQRVASVHFLMIPEFDAEQKNEVMERRVDSLQKYVELGRQARECKTANISFKLPVPSVTLCHSDPQVLEDSKALESYIADISGLNVKQVKYDTKLSSYAELECVGNFKSLGQRFQKDAKKVRDAVAKLTLQQAEQLKANGTLSLQVDGQAYELFPDDVQASWKPLVDESRYVCQVSGGYMLVLDKQLTEECLREGVAREFMSRVQHLRKTAGLKKEDKVMLYVEANEAKNLASVLRSFNDFVVKGLGLELNFSAPPSGAKSRGCQVEEIESVGTKEKYTLHLIESS
eukprot:gb/GEZN01000285.1/.p1 GENE.gb/GEZN01000285.1/~~gb/GEZN01000285.1/.p1  ORF type:complete len:1227 (-),score=269.97 gb/GEZN01000285.1/:227-3907(-)